MVKKSTKTSNVIEEAAAAPVVNTDIPVEQPVVEKKKRKTATKKIAEVVSEEVVEKEEGVEVKEEVSSTEVEVTKKKRRVIKKEDLAKDLDSLTRDLFDNVSNKELVKRIKQFKSDIIKILKLRNLTERKETDNSNSGFMKPVGVSDSMRQFLELKPDELTRRLDITKRLCEYIKVHDLQDPRDRRNILPDEVLTKLLELTPEDKLTYYSIQQKLKNHIIKV